MVSVAAGLAWLRYRVSRRPAGRMEQSSLGDVDVGAGGDQGMVTGEEERWTDGDSAVPYTDHDDAEIGGIDHGSELR